MSGEKFDNEQVEREEDNRLTKTEWEKTETIGKTVDDLKIRNLKTTLLNTLAVLIEAGAIGYFYFSGATDDLKHFLLYTLPMIVIAFIPYIKNVQEYSELKKDYKHELEIYELKKSKEGQGTRED